MAGAVAAARAAGRGALAEAEPSELESLVDGAAAEDEDEDAEDEEDASTSSDGVAEVAAVLSPALALTAAGVEDPAAGPAGAAAAVAVAVVVAVAGAAVILFPSAFLPYLSCILKYSAAYLACWTFLASTMSRSKDACSALRRASEARLESRRCASFVAPSDRKLELQETEERTLNACRHKAATRRKSTERDR